MANIVCVLRFFWYLCKKFEHGFCPLLMRGGKACVCYEKFVKRDDSKRQLSSKVRAIWKRKTIKTKQNAEEVFVHICPCARRLK